jgi:hypothetical protein
MTLTLVEAKHDAAILAEYGQKLQRVVDEAYHIPLTGAIAATRCERYAALLDEIRHVAASTKWHDTGDAGRALRMILDLCDGRDDAMGEVEAGRTGAVRGSPSLQRLDFGLPGGTPRMNVAMSERLRKQENPADFCTDKECLWRVVTRTGIKPCPKHMTSYTDVKNGVDVELATADEMDDGRRVDEYDAYDPSDLPLGSDQR